jgi:hypothetical protein
MKMSILKLITLCGAAFTAFSCIDTDTPQGNIDTGDGTGTLRLSSISVIDQTADKGSVSTRAISPADFDVTITRTSTGDVAFDDKYSAFPAELTLNAGDYSLYIESHEAVNATWDVVHYSATRTFSIVKDTETPLSVECKVSSVLVSVRYTDRMKALWPEAANEGVTVMLGEKNSEEGDIAYKLFYGQDKVDTGVFKPLEEENILYWEFVGQLDGQNIEQSRAITGVKAGQHRTLTFDIVVDEMGNAIFPLTVSMECEVVDINANINLGEEEIIDRFNPVEFAVSEGWKTDAANVIYMGDYDSANPYDIKITMTAAEGFATANWQVTSPYALSTLTQDKYGNLSAGLDLTVDPVSEATTFINSTLGIKTGASVLGANEYVLDVNKLMSNFYGSLSFGPDSSTFTVTLTGSDGSGESFSQTLTFDLRKGNEPSETSILTVTGSGIAERMVIQASALPTVSVNIVASAGVKDFIVSMESSEPSFNGVLAEMSPLGLLDETKYTTLEGLGLPYGNAVKDKTELPFDISTFVPMMAGFIGESSGFTADFHLTITDNTDKVINETIKLQITQ